MSLNCQSYDCGYNDKKGKCYATTIAIGGVNAQNTDGTTCESYVVPSGETQKYEFANEFLGENGSPSSVYNIRCEAMNCRYNSNKDCTAENVEIDNKNARCETFIT